VRSRQHESAGSNLPLPLRFLAAWRTVWPGRDLQQQADYLEAENRSRKEALGDRIPRGYGP